VVSNVSASPPSSSHSNSTIKSLKAKDATANGTTQDRTVPTTSTKITIHGYLHGDKESVLLQLHPQSHTLASEWLDGLLMLLNQQPITAETNKLVNLVAGYSLKIRLLNVRFEDVGLDEPALPSREGLDEDYWYDIGGMEAGA
jgi:engulfment/cell motility protein 1